MKKSNEIGSDELDNLEHELDILDLRVSYDENYSIEMIKASTKQVQEVIGEIMGDLRTGHIGYLLSAGIAEIRACVKGYVKGYIQGLFLHSNIIAPHAIAMEKVFNEFFNSFDQSDTTNFKV